MTAARPAAEAPQAGSSPPPTVTRHGVLVVHGQEDEARPGEMLARVANPIAAMLRAETSEVDLDFTVVGGEACASLRVRPLAAPAAQVRERRFLFREVFWNDAFPPPPPGSVVSWVSRSLRRQVPAVVRGWLRSPRVDEHGHQHDDDPDRGAATPLGRLAFLVVAAVSVLGAIPLIMLGTLLGLVVYPLANIPLLNRLGLASLNNVIASTVNPFMSRVLGDTRRFMDNEAWADNARHRFEAQLEALLDDKSIEDLTVIAYSAGCTVMFGGLREGGPAEAALRARPQLPVHIVTVGSALNRVFVFAEDAASASGRRFLQQRVTEELVRDGRPYSWTDIFARFDFVPGGPMRDEVRRATRVDEGRLESESRLESRQVINYDSPTRDHFAYFENTDVVVPRLISAMYGGYLPEAQRPPNATEGARAPVHVTAEAARRRSYRVGALRLIVMGSYFVAATLGLAFLASSAVRRWHQNLAFDLGDLLGPLGEWEIVQFLGDWTGLTTTAAAHPDVVGLALVAGGVLVLGRVLGGVGVDYIAGRVREITRVL
ncbi:MAG: hypothetical protein O2895_00785 [Chloroflexi bacterium]|nr:hypothetical protein [Chloroflexota bacterium]